MLAFANKAAAEMQERLENRLGHSEVTASTFHKLGKNIIAKVEGEQPSLSPLAEDDKLLAWHINNWHTQHLEEPAYKKLTLDYFETIFIQRQTLLTSNLKGPISTSFWQMISARLKVSWLRA